MVGATGPRMLRLTAELADHWNGGLRAIEEVPTLLAALDAACLEVGRDPGSITRSVEVLVRPRDVGSGDPPAVLQPAEEREIRGAPETIAAELRRFADLGIDHTKSSSARTPSGASTPSVPSSRRCAAASEGPLDRARMVTSFVERSN